MVLPSACYARNRVVARWLFIRNSLIASADSLLILNGALALIAGGNPKTNNENNMRLFSVEEANALLPEVKRLWRQIDQARMTMRQLAPGARLASQQSGGGGIPQGLEYVNALTNFMACAQEIIELGVEIKDFDKGLCDFPHMREGRVVYLCWMKGEDGIEWWHDVDAGFAGRQPL